MEKINALVRRVPESVIWVSALIPLIWLVIAAVRNDLGVDPVKEIEHSLGLWGFQFLIASLFISPLRMIGLNMLRFRRALGVTAFVYILLHFLAWMLLDMGMRWSEVLQDLAKRPYIIAGMIGFVAMVPLALTSTNAAIRAMGARSWKRLHRLAYIAAVAGAVHFVLLVKGWPAEPLVYSGIVLLLLAGRGVSRRKPAA